MVNSFGFKTSMPKNGIEFCQGFIAAFILSLAMLYNVGQLREVTYRKFDTLRKVTCRARLPLLKMENEENVKKGQNQVYQLKFYLSVYFQIDTPLF